MSLVSVRFTHRKLRVYLEYPLLNKFIKKYFTMLASKQNILCKNIYIIALFNSSKKLFKIFMFSDRIMPIFPLFYINKNMQKIFPKQPFPNIIYYVKKKRCYCINKKLLTLLDLCKIEGSAVNFLTFSGMLKSDHPNRPS